MQAQRYDSRKSTRESEKTIGSGQLNSGTRLNQEQALQRGGDTRWESHYKTLKSLSNLYPEMLKKKVQMMRRNIKLVVS
jgi:hypothetical protein